MPRHNDPEVTALARCLAILDALDETARKRVLLFLCNRHQITPAALFEHVAWHSTIATRQQEGESCQTKP